MIIKIILITILVLILRAFLVQKTLLLTRRILALLLFVILVYLVIFPETSTLVSQRFGIGRGADLIFYFSHLFLLLLIINLWRHTIVLSKQITVLARKLAINNAEKPDSPSRTS